MYNSTSNSFKWKTGEDTDGGGYSGGRASLVAQMVKNLPAVQKSWVPALGWKDPLEKGFQYSCLEDSLDRGARWATVHGVTKSRTRLSE